MYSNQISSAKWYSLLGIVLLVSIVFGLPSSTLANPAPWIILDQNGVRVTREQSGYGWDTTVNVSGTRYAVIRTGIASEGDSLLVTVNFQDGYKVEFPGHYPIGTTTPFTRIITPQGGVQLVPLGTVGAINSVATLSIYGFVSMIHNGRRVIVFPSGVIAAIGANATVVVFPDGPNRGVSTIGSPPHIQTLLQSLQAAFHAVSTLGGALPAVTVTNYTEPSLLSDEEVLGGDDKEEADDYENAEKKIECKELPPCCCEVPAYDGTCKDFHIIVHGAGSGGDGNRTAAGKILADMKSRPCHENAFSFVYGPAEDPKKVAERLAEFSNKVGEACGRLSHGTVSGVCYGGYLVWLAMDSLGYRNNWTLQFWNTPFKGAHGTHVFFTNLIPFGIGNLIWDRAQFNILYGTLPAGPSTIPPQVGRVEIHIGDGDAFLSQQSQRGPLNGRDLHEIHHDDGHFGTSRNFYEYIECCGDRQVNGLEDCDPEWSTCYKTTSGGDRVTGTCNGQCRCRVRDCGDNYVDPLFGEECDPPGEICNQLSWTDPSNGYGYTVTSNCNDECRCPPLVFPTSTPVVSVAATPQPTSVQNNSQEIDTTHQFGATVQHSGGEF